MNTRIFHLHALSALHVGTGQGIGAVDLPIARSRATNLPLVPGSALKGVLRDEAKEKWHVSENDIQALFGADSQADKENIHAGAAAFWRCTSIAASDPLVCRNSRLCHLPLYPATLCTRCTRDTAGKPQSTRFKRYRIRAGQHRIARFRQPNRLRMRMCCRAGIMKRWQSCSRHASLLPCFG